MTIPLVFYYHRLNCYSFNALAGAMDADPAFSDLPVDIALTAEHWRAGGLQVRYGGLSPEEAGGHPHLWLAA